MDAKEMRYYLQNIDGMKDEIKRLNENVEQYKKMEIETIMVKVIKEVPGRTKNISSDVEYQAIKRADYIVYLEQRISEIMNIIDAIMSVYNMCDSIEKYIMNRKYINWEIGKRPPTIEQIGYELHISSRQCSRIEAEIIDCMINIYNSKQITTNKLIDRNKSKIKS